MRALKPCTVSGCPELVASGRCIEHARLADRIRGNATQRGYTSAGHQRFRRLVLTRDPICTQPGCAARSTDADHWPLSRRELLAQGLNPNDPTHGRGLCHAHHSASTAHAQPGGWHHPA